MGSLPVPPNPLRSNRALGALSSWPTAPKVLLVPRKPVLSALGRPGKLPLAGTRLFQQKRAAGIVGETIRASHDVDSRLF